MYGRLLSGLCRFLLITFKIVSQSASAPCCCFRSHLCAWVRNNPREFPCVAVYILVYGWRALTEGHGSCTLSVWTLAEPQGVLFQARSDNLAPMTRLATAQFTGRSSTHAQPPPPPTSTSLLDPFSVPPAPFLTSLLCPPSPLSFISPFMLCFFTTLPAFPSLSISITLMSTRQKLSAGISRRQVPQTYQWRQNIFKYQTLTSLSGVWNELLLWITKCSLTH